MQERHDGRDGDRPLHEVQNEDEDSDPASEHTAGVRGSDVAAPGLKQVDTAEAAGEIPEGDRPDQVGTEQQEQDEP